DRLDGDRIPGSMDDAQPRHADCKGQVAQEIADFWPFPGRGPGKWCVEGGVGCFPAVEEPPRPVFCIVGQQVDFVIAQDGERASLVHELAYPADDAYAVGTAVAQVSDEYQQAFFCVRIPVQEVEQGIQGLDLAVDVADDGQGLGIQGME